ncbi:MAG: hypothetical protein HY548_06615, partial [Elusimicrobia bacterium]|nr:hypothetical protein [Elusimicrobiota bacterium]
MWLLLFSSVPASAQPKDTSRQNTSETVQDSSDKSPFRRVFHYLGLDIGRGRETDPDHLDPSPPHGLNRWLEGWDSRFVVRDDRVGFRAQYRRPSIVEKISLSYERRTDIPDRLGIGRTRDYVLNRMNQGVPRQEHGFLIGAAVAFNPSWGLSLTHDELSINDGKGHFMRWRSGAN